MLLKIPDSFSKLADKAEEVVDVTLDPAMLGLASKFLSDKDADEKAVIRQACHITDQAFQHILGRLKPGISERAVAAFWEPTTASTPSVLLCVGDRASYNAQRIALGEPPVAQPRVETRPDLANY